MSKGSSRARLGPRRIPKPLILDALIAAHEKALTTELGVPKRFAKGEAFRGAVARAVVDADQIRRILEVLRALRSSPNAPDVETPGTVIVTEGDSFGRGMHIVLADTACPVVSLPNVGKILVIGPAEFRGRTIGIPWEFSAGRPGEEVKVRKQVVDIY